MNNKSRALIVLVCAGIYVIFGILNSTVDLRFISMSEKESDEVSMLSLKANTISACKVNIEEDESDCVSRKGFVPRFLVFEIIPLLFAILLLGMALLVFLEPEGSGNQAARLEILRKIQRVGQILFAAMFLASLKELMTVYHILNAMKPEGQGADWVSSHIQWSFGVGFYMLFILPSIGLVASFWKMAPNGSVAMGPGFFPGGAPATPHMMAPPPPPSSIPVNFGASGSQASLSCPKCNFKVDVDGRFCKNCGHPMKLECPSCHAIHDGESRFCKACGANLQK